jgi:hypothetical protein
MDEDLRSIFQEIRAEDARTAPSLRNVLRAGDVRSLAKARWLRPLRLAAAVGAVGAVALVLLVPGRSRQPAEPGPGSGLETSGMWRAPSDFLLSTPGTEVVSDLPSLGRATLVKTSQTQW